MTLDRLILNNFTNYDSVDITLCPKLNCFVGNNGAGKTNLLDAVYYLSFTKSYFTPIDTQRIRIGSDYFALHGHYGDQMASCIVRRGHPKEMRWNKKICKTLGEHIGRLPLVMVSPSDQQLIIGPAEQRRKFLDGVISQIDHSYLDHLLQYTKALAQRNRLLKQMYDDRTWDQQQVDLWDQQLVRHGEQLYSSRARFVDDFLPLFRHYYSSIAPTDQDVSLSYQHDPSPLDRQLSASRNADRVATHTTVGPHRDDLLLLLAPDMPVRQYGSQGQQKSFSLALKLAQFHYISLHTQQKPILLLDDIFDKLDLQRVQQLIALVGSDRFGQVLLTDTQPGRVQNLLQSLPSLQHRIFQVANSTVDELGR